MVRLCGTRSWALLIHSSGCRMGCAGSLATITLVKVSTALSACQMLSPGINELFCVNVSQNMAREGAVTDPFVGSRMFSTRVMQSERRKVVNRDGSLQHESFASAVKKERNREDALKVWLPKSQQEARMRKRRNATVCLNPFMDWAFGKGVQLNKTRNQRMQISLCSFLRCEPTRAIAQVYIIRTKDVKAREGII